MKPALGLALAAVLAAAAPAAAMDNWRALGFAAIESQRQRATIAAPWLSQMRVDVAPKNIRAADGGVLMNPPAVGVDANQVTHNIGDFYAAKTPRLNAIMHYAGRRRGEIFSLGVDSGYSADIIRVKPAVFLGYTRAFSFTPNSHIAVSAGAWLGGEMQMRPCVDTYKRKYYCGANIVPWTDYRPPPQRTDIHRSLVWVYEF